MGFSVVVVFISWNMPLFKVWSEDKLNKKFAVAENFAELVSKGKRFSRGVEKAKATRQRKKQEKQNETMSV